MTRKTPRWLKTHKSSSLLGVIATVVLSSLLLLPVAIPAASHVGAPWGAGDMTAHYFIASTWEWWKHGFTYTFAFPFGLDTNLSVGLDGLSHFMVHLLNLATGSPFAGLNLMLLLSFPFVAALAYAAMRLVGLHGPLAVALGVSYTFIPFHFGRGIGHILLGLLIGVATGTLLAVLIGSGRLAYWMRSPSTRARLGYGILTALLVVTTAWTGIYYAVFGLILIAAAVLWQFSAGDRWRDLAPSLIAMLGLIVAMVLGLVPALLSRLASDDTQELLLRSPMDSVDYAGNLAIALVPQPYSVLSNSYNEFIFELFSGAPAGEPHLMANFGTWITSIALICLIVGLVTSRRRSIISQSLVTTADRFSIPARPPVASMTFVVYLIIVVLLFFVPWGLNYFFASFVTAQIRAWNRFEPYLLLLFLLGAAAALASWKWPRKPVPTWTISILILLVTMIDMVLPWRNLYTYVPENGSARLRTLQAYAAQVQSTLPENCGVLTLPYVPWPNAGPAVQMDDYDHFLIGLTNPRNPISYGVQRDSQNALVIEQLSTNLDVSAIWRLRELGFCGIHVDSNGYEDPAPQLAQLEQLLGPPVAQEGRWIMFSLSNA